MIEGPCVLWTGSVQKNGYGGGNPHRRAYTRKHGRIPRGLETDHLCNNPLCLNTDHMELVTHAENMRRRGARMTRCKRGHEYTSATTYTHNGKRSCRICRALSSRKFRLKLNH